MPFITLDGDLVLEVVEITERESELVGDESRADDGTHRAAVTDEKRRWDLELLEMPEADLLELRGRLALRAHVPVVGDAIGGATTVYGKLTNMGYVWLPDGGFLRTARLDLEEV